MKTFLKKIIRKILPARAYNELMPYFFHLPKAILANLIFGFPARKIRIIGVAGTKGKSTTTYLINQLLEALGFKTAILSTTTVKIGQNEQLNDFKMTSVDSMDLQKFLKKAAGENCQFAVLETSSHALKQFRTWGVGFEVVVLANMMPDHQEYHKSVDDYTFSHKKMIGSNTKALVLNGDDVNLEPFKKLDVRQITFGLHSGNSFYAKDVEINESGSEFRLVFSGHEQFFSTPLPGKFNLYNVLAALSAVRALDLDVSTLEKQVRELKAAPGRVEEIANNLGVEIIVDYAHSPDSFENLFSAIKPYVKKKLITVTGACGERDASKRPIMGSILAEYCNLVVITNDDPYGEDPEKIARELISGLTKSGKFFPAEGGSASGGESKNYWKILDRREAIKKAIQLAKKGDTIVILGKGAEQWQMFKDSKIPWDDRKVVREILSEF